MHSERPKPHHSGPTEFATNPFDTGEVANVLDPEPERSVEPIIDEMSQSFYKYEQFLSEASNVSLPSRRQHWMNTRLRTKLRAGQSQPHYQQFDYSTLELDDKPSGTMLPIPTYPQDRDQATLPPDLPVESRPTDPMSDVSFIHCLPQLVSHHELARSLLLQLLPSDNPQEQSPVGTPASLLTHPSLTDYLSNYPNGLTRLRTLTCPCRALHLLR